jgi:hypothetical protein
MPFPLQDTKRDQAAGEMMLLSLLRAGLTAREAELVLPDSNDFFNLRAESIEPADLHGRQRQTIGGNVCGAVSDDQYLQPPSQPTSLRPVGIAPIGPQGLAIAPPVLLQAADNIPALVMNALQQGFGGRPGIKEHICGATAPTIARRAEEFYGQLELRRSPLPPEACPQRKTERPIGPAQ